MLNCEFFENFMKMLNKIGIELNECVVFLKLIYIFLKLLVYVFFSDVQNIQFFGIELLYCLKFLFCVINENLEIILDDVSLCVCRFENVRVMEFLN